MIGLLHVAAIGAALVTHPGHLYVSTENSDGSVHAVYRYPMTNGIPSSQPDGVVGSLMAGAPTAIDVGSDGSLYLEDAQGIKVFAPSNPTGQPVRFVPLYTWFALAHDAAGDVFVSTGTGALFAYPPNSSTTSQPLATIPTNGNAVGGLAVGPDGDLYVMSSALNVFANPTTNPTLLRTACVPHSEFGVALSADGRVYVATPAGVARYPSSVQGCPAPPPEAFFKTGGIGIGVAVSGGYLYAATNAFPKATDFVDVFDVSDPKKPPVATITEPVQAEFILAIAVGP